jgi:hypothetical protein
VAVDKDDLGYGWGHTLEDMGEVLGFVESWDHDTDTHGRQDPVGNEAALIEKVARGSLDILNGEATGKLSGDALSTADPPRVQLNDVFGIAHVPFLLAGSGWNSFQSSPACTLVRLGGLKLNSY